MPSPQFWHVTLRGAREETEDAVACFSCRPWFIYAVADGHLSKERASVLPDLFCRAAGKSLGRYSPSTDHTEIVKCMLDAFACAVTATEGTQGGSTLTGFALHDDGVNKRYAWCLALGDSPGIIVDLATGGIAHIPMFFRWDTALPYAVCMGKRMPLQDGKNVRFPWCLGGDDGDAVLGDGGSGLNIWWDAPLPSQSNSPWEARPEAATTEIMDAWSSSEIARYRRVFGPDSIQVVRRKKQLPSENRIIMQLDQKSLPEPTRAIESMEYYMRRHPRHTAELLDIQRRPIVKAWVLPDDHHVMVSACSDGVTSKRAFPSPERLATAMCDPIRYISGLNCLEGTVVASTFPDVLGREDISDMIRSLQHHWGSALSNEDWQRRYRRSCEYVQAAVELSKTSRFQWKDIVLMIARMAVVFGSDDNVTVAAAIL
jgi:hypothetical protein